MIDAELHEKTVPYFRVHFCDYIYLVITLSRFMQIKFAQTQAKRGLCAHLSFHSSSKSNLANPPDNSTGMAAFRCGASPSVRATARCSGLRRSCGDGVVGVECEGRRGRRRARGGGVRGKVSVVTGTLGRLRGVWVGSFLGRVHAAAESQRTNIS